MGKGTCSVCGRKAGRGGAQGMCMTHYDYARKNGYCKELGCDVPARASGYCDTHDEIRRYRSYRTDHWKQQMQELRQTREEERSWDQHVAGGVRTMMDCRRWWR